jgi:hypothetical protein
MVPNLQFSHPFPSMNTLPSAIADKSELADSLKRLPH